MPREHCADQTRPNWKPHSWDKPSLQPETRSSLEILRASRQIYEEVSHMLYNRSLKIEIDPHNTRWVTKYLAANAWHFRHVDFARFRSVEREIFAPDRRDPGQLLFTTQLVLDLPCWHVGCNEVLDARFEGYQSFAHQALLNASSFENSSKCLTEIDIVVAQPGQASWHHGDLTQKSCNGGFSK